MSTVAPAGLFVGVAPPAGDGVTVCDVGDGEDVIGGAAQGDLPAETATSSQSTGIPEGAGWAGLFGDHPSVKLKGAG